MEKKRSIVQCERYKECDDRRCRHSKPHTKESDCRYAYCRYKDYKCKCIKVPKIRLILTKEEVEMDKKLVITIVNYKGYDRTTGYTCLEDLVGERLTGLIDMLDLDADEIKVKLK